MLKYILILGLMAIVTSDATIHLCSQRLVDLGLAAAVDDRPLHCRMIVISIVSVFAASAGWWKGRALLAYYAFAVAMLFASGLVAILATCSIPINPVRGMALIVVASFSQAALAVVTAMSQAATLTLASVLAKHAEEVDIDL